MSGRGGALTRAGLGTLGVLVGLYGAWLLWSRQGSTAALLSVGEWLLAGAVLHDAVLAPLTVVVVWLGARLLPGYARVPAVVGMVVLGSATLFAIPVLGRFGARADNPSLLNRHYWIGWFVLTALVLVAVVVASVVRRSRSAAGTGPTDQPAAAPRETS